jgi:hypothetical protein
MTPKNPDTETKIIKRLNLLAKNLCRAHCTKIPAEKFGEKITIHSDGCISLRRDLDTLWKNAKERDPK